MGKYDSVPIQGSSSVLAIKILISDILSQSMDCDHLICDKGRLATSEIYYPLVI
jgi:hypothetical protein